MESSLLAHRGQGEPGLRCSFHLRERAGREGGRLWFVSGNPGSGQRVILTERATLAGKTRELDLEDHTGTVWAGQGVDITLHVASVRIRALGKSSIRQSRLVHSSDRVVADNRSIPEFLEESAGKFIEREKQGLTNASVLS